ncbi:dihydrolipoamide acetyltransferase family protein [Salinicoccus roseus]|uniref:dihydrolipoamide acetyltransferase family protein n=1 Tax=Salinicoccus roseus TaxID=45670 RepID=UPI000F4EE78A|nr:dihydrolipoamide acetyltransferase family protein [Salinicoccus roseus]RPE54136.1 branched-chain alpha-keto acid dehydrogenase E2 component [Salinicoccus roseus]GGA67965.1 dihydrolipoamide acetyltransferase component of pyruvate dehydrogenase complex [Salinicoccus roseus]
MEEVLMPKLGESVTEGTIEKWLVQPGDTVEEYDPLCEVITDKVTAEVPSVFEGTIKELLVAEGDTVEVGTPVCLMDTDGAGEAGKADEDEGSAKASEEAAPSADENQEDAPSSTGKVEQGAQKKGKTRISPVVMRLAEEHDLDLNTIEGTGFEGRITKKDVLKTIEAGPVTAGTQTEAAPSTDQQADPASASGNIVAGDEIPVTGVRKAVANKMVQSSQEIPHAWMMMEVDATNLVNVRNSHKSAFKEREGFNLTFFSFFVKAVAETLKEYPMLNSSWQGDKIVLNKDINISIAVAGDDKLYVPVIRNADDLSIKGIAKQVGELAALGRSHKLTQEHMAGGTFTVNNTGAFGSVQSMGIINHPQAAILQVESIVKKPVIIDDMIAVRHMVNLCLSIDHRVLDGLVAGQFLKAVKERIEAYSVETTSIY